MTDCSSGFKLTVGLVQRSLVSREADGFIKIWQDFPWYSADDWDLRPSLVAVLSTHCKTLICYHSTLNTNAFLEVRGPNDNMKPLFLSPGQDFIKYIFSWMNHNDDFQDMVSELFKSRQGANASVISCANYTLKHRVCFIGPVTWLKTWLKIMIKNWQQGNEFKDHPQSLSATASAHKPV